MEATYNAPVAGIFPLTTEMLQLASSGVFVLHYPHHPFTKEVQRVAQQLHIGADEHAS